MTHKFTVTRSGQLSRHEGGIKLNFCACFWLFHWSLRMQEFQDCDWRQKIQMNFGDFPYCILKLSGQNGQFMSLILIFIVTKTINLMNFIFIKMLIFEAKNHHNFQKYHISLKATNCPSCSTVICQTEQCTIW